MKHLVALLVLMLMASAAFGGTDVGARLHAEQETIENGLLSDLQCENCTVRQNAMYELGEIGSSHAVLPLLSVLHNDPMESTRIVAALALCRIGDERGTYAVQQAASFDGSAKVRATCAWFYNQYVKEGTFSIKSASEPVEVVADVVR
jgi:hypothetical protein